MVVVHKDHPVELHQIRQYLQNRFFVARKKDPILKVDVQIDHPVEHLENLQDRIQLAKKKESILKVDVQMINCLICIMYYVLVIFFRRAEEAGWSGLYLEHFEFIITNLGNIPQNF